MIDAVRQDFRTDRRAAVRLGIFITTDGVPKDISAWSAKCQFRDTPGGVTAHLTVASSGATANGSLFSKPNAAGGEWQFYIDEADMTALPLNADVTQPRVFAYDILFTDELGDVNQFYYGEWTVTPGVTV